MRGKCERGQGSANVGAEVQTWTGRVRKAMRAMGARRGRLSAPWPRFHGVDRADVYIIIHVRACCCGECELNPPPSPPIPRQSPPLAPTQRHTLPEHFRSPTQPRPTPAGCAMHSPPTPQLIPRRRPSLAHAQRHALPEHFRSPTQPRRTPTQRRCTPADLTTHSPPKTSACPRTATRPSRALPLAHAAPTPARRLLDVFLVNRTTHSPQRHAASPSVPLRAQKNGTAQCMCDAECLGRPSLRSVIWVGEPRAVRRRCGALACRRGA